MARSRARFGLFAGAVALSLASLASPPVAFADEKQAARETFRAAESAFDRRDYRTAALGFEAANAKSPNGGALFNAAVAWTHAGEPARAAHDFSQALRSGDLDERRWSEAKKRRAALEPKLAFVTIRVPPDVRVSVAHVDQAT